MEGTASRTRLRQIEFLVRPVTGQVLPAARNRPVLFDQPGAADADERREPQPVLGGALHHVLEHVHEALHCLVAAGLIVAVTP